MIHLRFVSLAKATTSVVLQYLCLHIEIKYHAGVSRPHKNTVLPVGRVQGARGVWRGKMACHVALRKL